MVLEVCLGLKQVFNKNLTNRIYYDLKAFFANNPIVNNDIST